MPKDKSVPKLDSKEVSTIDSSEQATDDQKRSESESETLNSEMNNILDKAKVINQESLSKSGEQKNKKRGWKFKLFVGLSIVIFLVVLSLGGIAIAGYYYLNPYYNDLKVTIPQINQQVSELKIATKEQNLTRMENGVSDLRASLTSLDKIMDDFSWLQTMPRVQNYWYDGKHMTAGGYALLDAADSGIQSLVPYADLIGFIIESDSEINSKISSGVNDYINEKSDDDFAAIILLSKSIDEDIKNKFDELNVSITGENDDKINVDINSQTADSLTDVQEVLYVYLESETKQVTSKFADLGLGESQTAEDRIQFVVDTLDKLVPQLDEISGHIEKAESEFAKIDVSKYPDEVRGVKVRPMLLQMQDLTGQAKLLITDARPVLEVAPYILGNDEPREYLVLLQNDAELRPTGGFLTAYSLLTVDKGKITPGISKDIYDLDARYTSTTPAPDVLIKYLSDPYRKEQADGLTPKLRIRDSNISPDFKVAMDLFYNEYIDTGSKEVDGIIAVNTKFLLGLLEVMGPIGVGGIGNFSAEIIPECNCPQVVYALENAISYETSYIRENRKAIIGPLMHSVLANAMGTPKEKMSDLVQAGLDAIQQKHLMVYYLDEEVQSAVESFNMAGRIVESENDYLAIVDTNFAGAKSNLYVQQEVELKINPSDNNAIHELTITYKNPQPHDGWLNGEYFDWVRIYVPKGSKLIEDVGSETPMEVSEDLGKTVFSGFFSLRPEGLARLVVKYETPVEQLSPYKLLVQKQGGTDNFYYVVDVNGQVKEFELDGDQHLVYDI